MTWFWLAWLWTRDHTAPRALKQNKWIQTQRRLDEWETELPPCLTERPHPSFIENQIPHTQNHDRDINSQASRGGRSLYLFCRHYKRKQALFCIHELGEPTMTAVPLQVWQYSAGSLGWSGQGLWSQSTAKTPTTFNKACGKHATTVTSQVIRVNGAF